MRSYIWTVTAAVLLSTSPAQADWFGGRGGGGGWHGPKRGQHMRLMHIARQAGLSDKQIADIKKLHFQNERQSLQLQMQAKSARLDLAEAMDADSPSAGKVGGLVDKLGKLQTELHKRRVLLLLKVRGLLSKEQWRKLQSLHAGGMGGRFGGGHHPRWPRPPMGPGGGGGMGHH